MTMILLLFLFQFNLMREHMIALTLNDTLDAFITNISMLLMTSEVADFATCVFQSNFCQSKTGKLFNVSAGNSNIAHEGCSWL